MMTLDKIRYFEARIPFTRSFRHGSAERNETESIVVEIRDTRDITGYGEGCPRSYVTGESISSARRFFKRHHAEFLEMKSLEDLQRYCQTNRLEIDANPAAWCAVELALLDLLSRIKALPIELLLGLEQARPSYQYSAILGDSKPEVFWELYHMYRRQGFSDFKIKLSNDLNRDREKLECLRKDLKEIRIRADANNIWESIDQAAAHIAALNIPFWAVEEPIAIGKWQELQAFYKQTGIRIILDESFLRVDQAGFLLQCRESWIVNIRVSKMGGLLRSLEVIRKLTESGIQMIVGAQVGETSLLTRAALVAADASLDRLCAQEGAFGALLLERDPFEPVLQFGKYGRLSDDLLALRKSPGFGLHPEAAFDGAADFLLLQ